ncbi:MAG: hypothetical protein J7L52_02250 [Thermotogae bacterium]|nr:hypothetical protein [Thermotogota bacterium]
MNPLRDLIRTILTEIRGLKVENLDHRIVVGRIKKVSFSPPTASYGIKTNPKIHGTRCFEAISHIHSPSLKSYVDTKVFSPTGCEPDVFELRTHSRMSIAKWNVKMPKVRIFQTRFPKTFRKVKSLKMVRKFLVKAYSRGMKVSLSPISLRKDETVLRTLRVLHLRYPDTQITYIGKYHGVPEKARNFSLKGNRLVFEYTPSGEYHKITYMVFKDDRNNRLIMVRRNEET